MTQDSSPSHQVTINMPDHLAPSNGTCSIAPPDPSAYPPASGSAPWETTRIAWIEVLETGVVELDAWHMQLVNDSNHLLELIAHRAPWLRIVAASMLLGAKLLDHFRFEEEIMQRGGFPRRNAHAAEHKRIERQLSRLLTRIRELDGSQEQHYVLPTSFKPILIDLMVRHDLDYRSHLLYRLGR